MQRRNVILHNAQEVIAVFEVDEEIRNVTVKNAALAAKYFQHRADKAKVDGVAMTDMQAADKECTEACAALQEEYRKKAEALGKARDGRVEAAKQVQATENAKLAEARKKLDAEAFAAAESQVAEQEKVAQ